MNSANPLKDIYSYIQGNIRYKLYYSINWKWLIRKHIREQIDYRIRRMNQECYSKGQCIICGCQTTHLQMANKPCDGYEYPPIVSKYKWHEYSFNYKAIEYGEYYWFYQKETNKLIILKKTGVGYVQQNTH